MAANEQQHDQWSGMGTGWAITSTMIGGIAHPRAAGATCSTGCSGSRMCSCRSGSSWAAPPASTSSGFGTGGERVTRPEPERELIRRVSPFALPAAILAYVVGAALRRRGCGLVRRHRDRPRLPELLGERATPSRGPPRCRRRSSASSRSAATSARLIIYTLALVGLNQLAWFSPARVRARAGARDRRAPRLRDQGAVRPHAGRPLDVRRSAAAVIAGILAATFEPPSTEDFVFGCWGPTVKVGGFDLCFNFITVAGGPHDDHRAAAVLRRVPQAQGGAGQVPVADGAGRAVRAREHRRTDARAPARRRSCRSWRRSSSSS